MYWGEMTSRNSLAGRQALAVDFDEQLTRDAQTFIDAVAFVQVGVIDQTLPAHGGAGLFEIHAHHDFQGVGKALAFGFQTACVFQRSGGVVDGAGADHHQQAVILTVHDVVDGISGVGNQLLGSRALDRKEADQVLGRWQDGDVLDALVRRSDWWHPSVSGSRERKTS